MSGTPQFTTFYTTAETEAKLRDMYETQLRRKQAKLDEHDRKTGTVSKYNARAFVKQPAREFYVMDGDIYYKTHDTFIKCPREHEEGGGIYILEPRLNAAIARFQTRHTTFRVVFEPHDYYKSGRHVCPATLYTIVHDDDDAPEILSIEILSNYEL